MIETIIKDRKMTLLWQVPGIEFQPFDEIVEERPIVLVTSPGAWQAVENDLRSLDIQRRVEVRRATISHWTELAADLLSEKSRIDQGVIYAAGTGIVADAAKYLAHHTRMPLFCLPTALSIDTFFTPASRVRHGGYVEYLETGPPDKVLIDFDFIAAAPEKLRAAGICDILSIATALWDWEYAEEADKNPEGMELVPWATDAAMAILQGAIDCAEAAGAGDPGGIKQLLDCLVLKVQLSNLLGHTRIEEGSEHYFASAVENQLDKKLPHAEMVGPGILFTAERQDQETEELEYALEVCHIALDHIPKAVIEATHKTLRTYVHENDLPFGIAHEWNED